MSDRWDGRGGGKCYTGTPGSGTTGSSAAAKSTRWSVARIVFSVSHRIALVSER